VIKAKKFPEREKRGKKSTLDLEVGEMLPMQEV
jgi:hypothetical protein